MEYHDVDIAFCKSVCGSLGRSTAYRQGMAKNRVGISSSQNEMLPLPWWRWSSINSLPATGEFADPPREKCYIGNSLLVSPADRSGLSRVYSQIRLGNWKSIFLSPDITSSPATLLMSPWVVTGVAGEIFWLVSTECVIIFTWLLKSYSAEVTLWWTFPWDSNIRTFFALSQRPIYFWWIYWEGWRQRHMPDQSQQTRYQGMC